MHLFVFAVIVLFFGKSSFSVQVVSNPNATDDDIFTPATYDDSFEAIKQDEIEKEQPVQPLPKRTMQNNKPLPVYDRSMEGGGSGGKGKETSFALGSNGRVVLGIIIVGLIGLVFLLAMYVQQRNDSVPPVEDSKTQEAFEAKQELKGRAYVVKRYIHFYFENGLPCPQHNYGRSVSSESGVASVSPPKDVVVVKKAD